MKRFAHLTVTAIVCLLGVVAVSCVEQGPESGSEPVTAPGEAIGEAVQDSVTTPGAPNHCLSTDHIFRPKCHTQSTYVADASCHATVSVLDDVCDPASPQGLFISCGATTPTTGVNGVNVTLGLGANQPVNVTCTNPASAQATCHETVNVVDQTPPTITCPGSQTLCGASGPGGFSVPTPTSRDNCGAPTVVCSPDPYALLLAPGAAATISCTATDGSGNTNACTYTVIAPYNPLGIVCPADQTSATSVVSFAPTTSGGNGTVSVSCTPTSGSTFAGGDNIVTCTASDSSAQVAGCTFHIRL